jgi:hypothetical protein
LEALGRIEDFRNLANTAEQIVTSSKLLKQAKRDSPDNKLSKEQKKEQSKPPSAARRSEKLQKLLAKIPVFMYVTQIREQALKDIILGVDGPLFERVTGLERRGLQAAQPDRVFNPIHMNAAIYQFKAFEDSSLEYAEDRQLRKEASRSACGIGCCKQARTSRTCSAAGRLLERQADQTVPGRWNSRRPATPRRSPTGPGMCLRNTRSCPTSTSVRRRPEPGLPAVTRRRRRAERHRCYIGETDVIANRLRSHDAKRRNGTGS